MEDDINADICQIIRKILCCQSGDLIDIII